MLGLRRIDHIGLRVAYLDEAVPRWCVQFGLTESGREDGRAFLRCGYEPYSLELLESDAPGFDHHAFELVGPPVALGFLKRAAVTPGAAVVVRGADGAKIPAGVGDRWFWAP